MPYFFTSSERALIQQALDQTDGLAYDELTGQYEYNKEGGNAVPVYQALYEILVIKSADDLISLSDMQDIKNATLWLSVAGEANERRVIDYFLIPIEQHLRESLGER